MTLTVVFEAVTVDDEDDEDSDIWEGVLGRVSLATDSALGLLAVADIF